MSLRDSTPRIITGLPGGKIKPRADFKVEQFDQLIQAKGYRLWWSRAAVCPCQNNDQTEQADPNCSLCRGRGYFYFMPDTAVSDGAAEDSFGNPIETLGDNAICIKGVMSGFTSDNQMFEKFGEYVFGSSKVTVQWQNSLGYRDRLVSRDSIMPWSEIVVSDGESIIKTTGTHSKAGIRYPLVEIIYCRSLATEYRLDRDFEITADGEIQWLASGSGPPAVGTRLSLSAFVHPTWVVMDHPNVLRDTLSAWKVKPEADQFKHLPIQALVKLDFLI